MNNESFIILGNIIFLGTSHISKQSLEEVEYLIGHESPKIIALELDAGRYNSLMQKNKEKIWLKHILKIGIRGYAFALIGAWAEKKLGEYTGIPPGSEMKHAIQLAKKNNIAIALIDQDIQLTLSKLSRAITWKEKFNFLADIIKAVFFSIFLRKKAVAEFDIKTVPDKEIIKKLLVKVKKRYPSIYKVLVTERNKVMASNLKKLSHQNPGEKILAVLGAAHIDGVVRFYNQHI